MPENSEKPEISRRPSEKPEVPLSHEERSANTVITPRLLVIAAIAALFASLLTWLLTGGIGGKTTNLSREQTSATSEAISFATSEASRKATRDVTGATQTALAQVTATAQTRENNAVASRTAAAVFAQATGTAQAPITLTAQAQEFETALTQAEATVQILNSDATVLQGPSNGSLDQVKPGEIACSSPHTISSNFVLEASFQNPQPIPNQPPDQGWDYGAIFAHPNDGLQYRMILNSAGKWTLNLHTDGYDISNSDTTKLLDTSGGAKNTLKLFVVNDTAQLYINGTYIGTLALTMFEQGGGSADGYDVSICAGIQQEDAVAGRSTTYDGYTLWSLP